MKKTTFLLTPIFAVFFSVSVYAQQQAATTDANSKPRFTRIKKVENGRTRSVQYKLKTAKKILGYWSKYQQLPEDSELKMQFYDIAMQQKDALITEIYNLCSDSGSKENEYCQIYADVVRTLAPIPDFVPGKWTNPQQQ